MKGNDFSALKQTRETASTAKPSSRLSRYNDAKSVSLVGGIRIWYGKCGATGILLFMISFGSASPVALLHYNIYNVKHRSCMFVLKTIYNMTSLGGIKIAYQLVDVQLDG